jgi:mycoredoxin
MPVAGVTIYSTNWCGYCTRLKRQLDQDGIAYEEIDIEMDPESEAFVLAANNGLATVPTVRLPGGAVLSNPTIHELRSALRSQAAG